MVTLEMLRADLQKTLDVDKAIHSVGVRGATLDECLNDASVQLDIRKKDLEYEIIEKGSAGFAGLMKKPWTIRVYENPSLVREKIQKAGALARKEEEAKAPEVARQDGAYYIHRFGSHIYIKVSLPAGGGAPVALSEVLSDARRVDNIYLDEELLRSSVKNGTAGDYLEIGSFNHIGRNDAVMALDISKDEMQATITVTPPDAGGSDISKSDVLNGLRAHGISFGIQEDKIISFVDRPIYGMPYEVAAAIRPVNGADAYIDYKFETDTTKLRLKETESGQVDFKELDLVQNVVAGQPLAVKVNAERGKAGKTITGRVLAATDGKDCDILLGQNTKLDNDGRTVLAEKNGHVSLVAGRITVEEVFEVKGVNIKTGNITYMGSVVCRGNVEDGFNIKADGNIEIYGSVGRCRIEAGGDIVISQGVMGHDEGVIISQKSVVARFLQNVTVSAENYVVVNDSIMNSNVTAMKKIEVKGKRASIIGGHLFATEEITAKTIGSANGGVETILKVGFDPKAKKKCEELQAEQSDIVKQLEELDLNIGTLEKQLEIRKSLPPEKEASLAALRSRRVELIDESEKLTGQINKINAHLRDIKVSGNVNASGTVYPGVKIFVRDIRDEVKNEVKAVTFYYDGGFVKRGKFNPSKGKKEVPGGNSTN